MLRFVTKKYQIVEIVTRFGLFKRKLNSDNLATHLLQTINERLTLPLCAWVTVQLDWASTNKPEISKIKSEGLDANPTQNFCAYHRIKNATKILIYCAKFNEHFRKLWHQVVHYTDKAREFASSVFKEPIKEYRSVRFSIF